MQWHALACANQNCNVSDAKQTPKCHHNDEKDNGLPHMLNTWLKHIKSYNGFIASIKCKLKVSSPHTMFPPPRSHKQQLVARVVCSCLSDKGSSRRATGHEVVSTPSHASQMSSSGTSPTKAPRGGNHPPCQLRGSYGSGEGQLEVACIVDTAYTDSTGSCLVEYISLAVMANPGSTVVYLRQTHRKA